MKPEKGTTQRSRPTTVATEAAICSAPTEKEASSWSTTPMSRENRFVIWPNEYQKVPGYVRRDFWRLPALQRPGIPAHYDVSETTLRGGEKTGWNVDKALFVTLPEFGLHALLRRCGRPIVLITGSLASSGYISRPASEQSRHDVSSRRSIGSMSSLGVSRMTGSLPFSL